MTPEREKNKKQNYKIILRSNLSFRLYSINLSYKILNRNQIKIREKDREKIMQTSGLISS